MDREIDRSSMPRPRAHETCSGRHQPHNKKNPPIGNHRHMAFARPRGTPRAMPPAALPGGQKGLTVSEKTPSRRCTHACVEVGVHAACACQVARLGRSANWGARACTTRSHIAAIHGRVTPDGASPALQSSSAPGQRPSELRRRPQASSDRQRTRRGHEHCVATTLELEVVSVSAPVLCLPEHLGRISVCNAQRRGVPREGALQGVGGVKAEQEWLVAMVRAAIWPFEPCCAVIMTTRCRTAEQQMFEIHT